LTCQDRGRKRSSFLLKKNPTGREYSFLYGLFRGVIHKIGR
jgi:hypothetical protein